MAKVRRAGGRPLPNWAKVSIAALLGLAAGFMAYVLLFAIFTARDGDVGAKTIELTAYVICPPSWLINYRVPTVVFFSIPGLNAALYAVVEWCFIRLRPSHPAAWA